MGHRHGTETLLSIIRPTQCIMNHHGSGYYDHILACIIFYTIVMGTSHSTVPDSLALYMQLSGELIGSVDTIIFVLALQCHSCNHVFPIKL